MSGTHIETAPYGRQHSILLIQVKGACFPLNSGSFAAARECRKHNMLGGYLEKMVPGGGIEPPTRGFSIRCSTPELPGRATGEARYLTKACNLVHAVFSHLLTSLGRARRRQGRRVRPEWRILPTATCSDRHLRNVSNRKAGTAQRRDSSGTGRISVGWISGKQVCSWGLIYDWRGLRRGQV